MNIELLQQVAFWSVAAFIYAAIGYQIAKLSYRVWDAIGLISGDINNPSSSLLRVALYPIRAHAEIRKVPAAQLLIRRSVEGADTFDYVFLHMFFWPLRIAWNLLAIAGLYVALPIGALIVWILLGMIGDCLSVIGRLFQKPAPR